MIEPQRQDELLAGARVIASAFHAAGHEALFVGGCVRDRLLGLSLKDIDIATNARPEHIERLFPGAKFVGAPFGVSLIRQGEFDYEVATFRRDGRYLDHRHPDTVSYGSMEDDARRRDFTINALYEHPETGAIIDLVGGQADLHARLLRCVGEPRKRFNEDALRLLRAVRFAARFGFQMETLTREAIFELAPTIQYVSPERHRMELDRIFTGPNAGAGLRMLAATGLLHWLLPEIEAMQGIEQGREYHPEGDVFEHTCRVLDAVEPRTTVNSWGALLHDVGKPPTYRRDEEGRITFYEHPEVGATIAEDILGRLRFSTDEIEAICAVVKRHMQFMNLPRMRESTLRRFLAAPTIEADLAVHRADCLGSHGNIAHWHFAQDRRRVYAETARPLLPPPLINGHDLIALGIPPGPELGRLLREIQDRQLEGALETREAALDWVNDRERRGVS